MTEGQGSGLLTKQAKVEHRKATSICTSEGIA